MLEPKDIDLYSRWLRAMLRRVADEDTEGMATIDRLLRQATAAIPAAVAIGKRRHGFSYAELAQGFGVSKQAATQRFGPAVYEVRGLENDPEAALEYIRDAIGQAGR